MERVTRFYGSNVAGSLDVRCESDGISDFFRELNIGSASRANSKVVEYLRSFERLDEYNDAPIFAKPVSVVYSPMYLQKVAKKEFPKAESFSAMLISGDENRPDRDMSLFQNAIYWKTKAMTEQGNWNYLDFIFGPYIRRNRHWISNLDFEAIRNLQEKIGASGSARAAFNRRVSLECEYSMPAKVSVARKMPDRGVAIAAVAALYEGNRVVLKLEPQCDFNFRATELLIQIYSLIQPWRAAEIGFATYQSAANIDHFSSTPNIRFFVVPSTVEFAEHGDFVVLDLARRVTPPADADLKAVLKAWCALDWETERQPAMLSLFRGVNQDKATFVEVSNEFFTNVKDLRAWELDETRNGSIDSLHSLRGEYEAHAKWWTIPWAEDVFRKKIDSLLGAKKLATLNSEITAAAFIADRDRQAPTASDSQDRKFGQRFGSVDSKRLCEQIWNEQAVRSSQALDAQKASLEKIASEQEQRHNEVLRSKDATIEQKDQLIANKEEEKIKAIAEKEAEKTKAIAEKEAEKNKAIADKEAEKEAAIVAKDEEKANAIAEKDKVIADKDKIIAEKTAETTRVIAEKDAEKQTALTKLEAHLKTTHEAEIAQVSRSLQASEQEKHNLSHRLEDAERDLAVAQNALGKADEEVKDLRKKLGEDPQNLIHKKYVFMMIGVAAAAGAVLVGLIWLLVALLSKSPVIPCQEQGHATEVRGAVQATCTQAGSTGDVYCTVCNEVIVPATVLPALEHQWGEASYVEATDEQGAMNVFTCSVCGTTKEEPVEEVEPETEPTLPPESSPVEYIDWSQEDAEELLLSAVDASIVSRDGLEFSDELQKLAETCEVITVISNGEVESEDGPNYAVLMKGHADSPVDPVEGSVVTAQGGSYVLVAYGNDSTTLAGIRALALSTKAPSEDASMEEGVDVTAESTNTEAPAVFYMNVDGRYVDLNAMFESNDWWLDIKSWDTTGEHAPFKIAPSLSVETQQLSAYLINYEDDVDGASSLVENYTTSERAEPNEFGYQNKGLALVGQRN